MQSKYSIQRSTQPHTILTFSNAKNAQPKQEDEDSSNLSMMMGSAWNCHLCCFESEEKRVKRKRSYSNHFQYKSQVRTKQNKYQVREDGIEKYLIEENDEEGGNKRSINKNCQDRDPGGEDGCKISLSKVKGNQIYALNRNSNRRKIHTEHHESNGIEKIKKHTNNPCATDRVSKNQTENKKIKYYNPGQMFAKNKNQQHIDIDKLDNEISQIELRYQQKISELKAIKTQLQGKLSQLARI